MVHTTQLLPSTALKHHESVQRVSLTLPTEPSAPPTQWVTSMKVTGGVTMELTVAQWWCAPKAAAATPRPLGRCARARLAPVGAVRPRLPALPPLERRAAPGLPPSLRRASFGDTELSLSVEYYGLTPSSEHLILDGRALFSELQVSSGEFRGAQGSSGEMRRDQRRSSTGARHDLVALPTAGAPSLLSSLQVLAPFRRTPCEPEGSLTHLKRAVRPHVAKLLPPAPSLEGAPGVGDAWPDNLVIYDYLIGYKFSLKEALEVSVRFPSLNCHLYESPYEAQLWGIFDSNKRLVTYGDYYPEPTKLPAGECVNTRAPSPASAASTSTAPSPPPTAPSTTPSHRPSSRHEPPPC